MRGGRLLLAALVATALLVLPATATAAGTKQAADVGLRITPLRSFPVQNPGSSTASSITLTNVTPDTQNVALSAEVFKVTDEQYNYNFVPSDTSSWIQFATKNLILAPEHSQTVGYTINVPIGATPGGHYFVLIASTTPTTNGNQIVEVRRVASLIYLQVNGKLSLKSEMLGFSVPWLTSKPNIPIEAQVANTGNTHIVARLGVVTVRQPWGHSFNLTQIQNLILPGTVRQVTGSGSLPNVPGLYKVSVQYSPPVGGPTTMSHYTLYLPWWFLLIGLAVLLFIIFLIWEQRHHRSHMAEHATEHKKSS